MGEVADRIRAKLNSAFAPDRLEVQDDSAKHAGHAGHREAGETHFTVTIASPRFAGMSRVERQRAVNSVLDQEFRPNGVHALSIHALAPGEG